uniref:Major facilitator superfamily (MFS) profile domain-containing protein n=1 Tax=Strigamia maritima TaxID=126957 RepID=T1JH51_STRMM
MRDARKQSATDYYVLTGAICVSTSAMAVLEPCLPIWLMDTIKPEKWQLGTVFVPDSLGYLLGSNLGIPLATAMSHLILPHFGMGLGIGLTDAALMPLLAWLVDARHVAVYGSVYAIAQVAVSLAYSLGPLVGGEVVKSVGFPWLLRTVGIINLLYCPLCFFLRDPPINEETQFLLHEVKAVIDARYNYEQSNIIFV